MKVLIIDGVRMFQQLVASLFANTGLEPVVASSGAACLDALREGQYGFICISMHLEDTTGIDLARQIRQAPGHAYTPIILFTSEHSPTLLSQAITAGVTEIFDKARDLDQLVTYVKRFTIQHQPIHGRVLYVEDSRSLRLTTKELLRSRGLSVDGFSKAEAAWTAFLQEDYDLVITDIVLAGAMSGLELINRIRRLDSRKGDVPILAVTGFDDVARRIALFHVGVNDYAIKPLVEEELIARVRYLISTSQAIGRQLRLVHRLFDYSPNGVLVVDHQHLIVQANDAFSRMTIIPGDELVGSDLSALPLTFDDAGGFPGVWEQLLIQRHWSGRCRLLGPLEERIPCHLHMEQMEGDTAALQQYLAIWRDMRSVS